jgi:hypothetical protein
MNGRFIYAGVLGVALFLPAAGSATDVADVGAALPEEATECRQLLSLCQPAEAALKQVQEVTRKRERYERLPPESQTPATLEAVSKLQAQEKAARNDFNTRLQQSVAAAAAVRAHHAKPPACFQRCPNVLRSDLKVWE